MNGVQGQRADALYLPLPIHEPGLTRHQRRISRLNCPCQLEYQTTFADQNLIATHDNVTCFPVGGDNQVVIYHGDFQMEWLPGFGGTAFQQQVEKDFGGHLTVTGCLSLYVVVNQSIEFRLAHLCKRL